jgi:hypothetical protein
LGPGSGETRAHDGVEILNHQYVRWQNAPLVQTGTWGTLPYQLDNVALANPTSKPRTDRGVHP